MAPKKQQAKQPDMNQLLRAKAQRNQTTVVARGTDKAYKQAGDWIRQQAKRNTLEMPVEHVFTQQQEQQQ